MTTVYLNGQFLPLEAAHISVMDRGFLFGDGVYEVVPVFGGRCFRLEEHLDRLDRSLIEASLDLGAGHFRTIMRIVVPLAAPGIIAGVMITLIPALGAYLTPDLMGGTDSQMIANVIERQFKKANDWPFGAALSFLLIYAMFALIAIQSMRKKVPEVR